MNLNSALVEWCISLLSDLYDNFFSREKPTQSAAVETTVSSSTETATVSQEEQIVQRFIDKHFWVHDCTIDQFSVTAERGIGVRWVVLSDGNTEIATLTRDFHYKRRNTVKLSTDHVSHDLNSIQDYRNLPDEHKAVVYLIAKAAKKQYDEDDAALLKEKAEKQVLVDALCDKYLSEVGRSSE